MTCMPSQPIRCAPLDGRRRLGTSRTGVQPIAALCLAYAFSHRFTDDRDRLAVYLVAISRRHSSGFPGDPPC
jgi:hypothetical protein